MRLDLLINIGIGISIGSIILIRLWKKKDEILSFIYPERYCEVEMIEKNGDISNWIQKKNDDLIFVFKARPYQLFYLDNENNRKFLFRAGRLSKFYYQEGVKEPINPVNPNLLLSSETTDQLLKIRIGDLIRGEDNPMSDFFTKYWWIFALIIVILLGISALRK